MKKFISGLIIGILIALSITTFAAVELEIIPNPYEVLIDGNNSDVKGYNINGATYLKLTDFVEAGLGVTFNKDTKQIEITTPAANVSKSTTNTATNQLLLDSDGSILFDPFKNSINTDKEASVDSIKLYKVNGEKYVYFADIDTALKSTNIRLGLNNETHIATFTNKTKYADENNPYGTDEPYNLRKITINQISLGKYDDCFFTYEDWINRIIPFIKEGK